MHMNRRVAARVFLWSLVALTAASPVATAGLADFDHLWVRAGYPGGAGLELEWAGSDWWWSAGIGSEGRSSTLYLGARQFRNGAAYGAFLAGYIGVKAGSSSSPVGAVGVGWREPLDRLLIQGEFGFVVEGRPGLEAAISLGF